MKTVIMAGGLGTRLRPLTCDLPKPLVPIAGRPCLLRMLDLLHQEGLDSDVAVSVRYRKEEIEKALCGTKVKICAETAPLGTAGGVRNCAPFPADGVLVVSGDAVCDFDFRKILAFHRSHGGPVTVVTVRRDVPLEYGTCVTDPNGRIVRFVEKPSWSRIYSNLVNTGVYVLEREILEAIPEGKPFDFSKDLFPVLLRKKIPLFAYEETGYWCDIGDRESYLRCNLDAIDGKIRFPVLPHLLPSSQMLRHCVAGEKTRVGEETLAEDSVLGERCVLGRNTRLSRCVLDADVCIGDGVRVYDGAVLGRGVTVGEGSVISCGVRVFPGITVPAHTMVTKDLVISCEEAETDVLGLKAVLSADLAARTGAAAGAVFGGTVVVGCAEPRFVGDKLCVSGGLLRSGADVLDIGTVDRFVLSAFVREYGLSGGVYVAEDRVFLVEGDGLPLSDPVRRCWEKAMRESESISALSPGVYRQAGGAERRYKRILHRYMPDIPPLKMKVEAPDFLSDLVVHFAGKQGETLRVCNGRLSVDGYPEVTVRLAAAYAYGKIYGRVFVPYRFPHLLTKIGKQHGFDVVRLMLEDADRRFLLELWDPYRMAAVLIRYLAKHGTTFSALVRQLPSLSVCEHEVCTGVGRCRVLEQLAKEDDGKRELVEGIGFFEDRDIAGFVRVLPYEKKEAFRVIAEAADAEAAEELCTRYVERISAAEKNTDTLDKAE